MTNNSEEGQGSQWAVMPVMMMMMMMMMMIIQCYAPTEGGTEEEKESFILN
jgi:hypothetical protein